MRRRARRWTIALGAALALAIALFFALDVGSWQRLDLNKLDEVYTTTILYDDQGDEYAVLYNTVNRVPVPFSEIPKNVVNAFLAAEDKRFYTHWGVDPRRIAGALLSNIKSGEYSEGASTITQQLIKLTHLTSVKTLPRKANEALLALQLERRLSKDQILEKYLNLVSLGKGAYGVEAASRVYFGKSTGQLTLAEGAPLAAIVKAPSNYAPHLHPDNALRRRNFILGEMADDGYITADQAAAAQKEPIQLARAESETGYGWYVDNVLEDARRALNLGADEVLSGGYRIYTSLNRDMQKSADALFAQGARFPNPAADGTPAQAALAAIDPSNGEIQCLVGGREYATKRGLNRATQMKRQPGSAFKPISVYAAAIDQLHMGPTDFVNDAQRDFGGGYSPQNASGTYHGQVTLRQALARSMNAAAVDLITKTGVSSARRYAANAGVALDARDDNLSLALGS
ncbi:MAG: penicillin-binding protein 1A, partial [Clostridiales bacterium]|nr:penicillin-binding protein 1A [Clostridiales bacterium]